MHQAVRYTLRLVPRDVELRRVQEMQLRPDVVTLARFQGRITDRWYERKLRVPSHPPLSPGAITKFELHGGLFLGLAVPAKFVRG